jgi:hypothetical protein
LRKLGLSKRSQIASWVARRPGAGVGGRANT